MMISGRYQPANYLREIPPFIKYRRIESIANTKSLDGLIGDDFMIFEKGDGGNCQVRSWNFRVLVGTRSGYLFNKKSAKFPWFRKLLNWSYSNYQQLYKIPERFVIFGEWLGNHTIKYSREFVDNFFLIDILDLDTKRFIDYKISCDILCSLGIDCIKKFPILYKGRINSELVEGLLFEDSSFYKGPKEGLIIKDYFSRHQEFWKIYHPDFSEKSFVEGQIDFLTPARFRKNYFRLREEEGEKEIDIEKLVSAVYQNIKKEEGIQIEKDIIKKRLCRYLTEKRLVL